jgi:hypothetical protein
VRRGVMSVAGLEQKHRAVHVGRLRPVITETALRSASLFFAAILLVAMVHKLQLLRRGKAQSQPLIRSYRLRSAVAALLLVVAIVAEAATVAGLLLVPTIGFAASALLLSLYAFELRRLAPGESCGCFGEWLAVARRAEAIRRNIVLAVVAIVGAGVYQSGIVEPSAISQASAGSALVVVAVVVPFAIRRGVSERTSVLT